MIGTIAWRSSIEEARIEAREQNKDILIHLDDPGRDGCGAMRAMTYHDPGVVTFIGEMAVPVMFNVVEDPGVRVRFHSFWTPTVILQDVDGGEYRRTSGCLDPGLFLAEFSLGRALRHLNTGHFRAALELLESTLEATLTDPVLHAENLYWLGVAAFRVTGIAHDVEPAWRRLRLEHQGVSWARKTDFYFQLFNGV